MLKPANMKMYLGAEMMKYKMIAASFWCCTSVFRFSAQIRGAGPVWNWKKRYLWL